MSWSEEERLERRVVRMGEERLAGGWKARRE